MFYYRFCSLETEGDILFLYRNDWKLIWTRIENNYLHCRWQVKVKVHIKWKLRHIYKIQKMKKQFPFTSFICTKKPMGTTIVRLPTLFKISSFVFCGWKKEMIRLVNYRFDCNLNILQYVVSILLNHFTSGSNRDFFGNEWYQRNLLIESQTTAKKQYLPTLVINNEKLM